MVAKHKLGKMSDTIVGMISVLYVMYTLFLHKLNFPIAIYSIIFWDGSIAVMSIGNFFCHLLGWRHYRNVDR